MEPNLCTARPVVTLHHVIRRHQHTSGSSALGGWVEETLDFAGADGRNDSAVEDEHDYNMFMVRLYVTPCVVVRLQSEYLFDDFFSQALVEENYFLEVRKKKYGMNVHLL